MSAAKTKAQKLIDENPIMVFSKSYCPYCNETKRSFQRTLQELGAANTSVKYIELDLVEDGSAIQTALAGMTENNQRSVPNIWIKQAHIGGNSDLQDLNNAGNLKAKVKDALEL